jgi:predicted ATPase
MGELASLLDGALVLPSVAALGVRDEAGALDAEALTGRLVARLSESMSLLVLDNCEHLLDAVAAVVRRLLECCPELHILTSSRQRLGLPGELAWRVPSLSVPGIQGFEHSGAQERAFETPEHLMHYAAVRLFVERASAVHPEFRLASGAEAAAVAQICRRLDGIPLAIELAAARVRVLTPQQIAERLDDRLKLLTRGARGVLPRHQTLRALIDWSYDSLPEEEATLLRRLSVFAGGWTLEAAEAICGDEEALRVDSCSLLVSEKNPSGSQPSTINQQRPLTSSTCSTRWWIARWCWSMRSPRGCATGCWRRCGSIAGRNWRAPTSWWPSETGTGTGL